MTQRSSLENYTDNNTRQQDTTRAQHEAIRDNISITRRKTRQHEYNTAQHKYKESSGSKNRILHRTFCYWTI